METVFATVHNGQIVLCQPMPWPEGTQLEVRPAVDNSDEELRGMTEEEQGTTPEAIERWLAEWRSLPTPTMTERELAEWERRRQEDKERELASIPLRERRFESLK